MCNDTRTMLYVQGDVVVVVVMRSDISRSVANQKQAKKAYAEQKVRPEETRDVVDCESIVRRERMWKNGKVVIVGGGRRTIGVTP